MKGRSKGGEGPMATTSQQHSGRVTVRQTDRKPPKVTNASAYETHTAGWGGAVCIDRTQKTLRLQGHRLMRKAPVKQQFLFICLSL